MNFQKMERARDSRFALRFIMWNRFSELEHAAPKLPHGS